MQSTPSYFKMSSPPVQFESVSLSFGDRQILMEISYAFEVDKITAILGKSGSGKTTLLQIINGIIQPKSGAVKLFGHAIDFNNIQSLRLQIGYVVQQVGLFPHMTIQSNIGLLGRIIKMSKHEIVARVKELTEIVQLPPSCLHQFPHQLSGGEQQRAGLCRSMFLNPPLLLMDEPFASLDYETKKSIYQHLQSIQQHEPRTVVLVTHDWEEALTLADRFVWIKDGIIKERGDKSDLEKLKSILLAEQ